MYLVANLTRRVGRGMHVRVRIPVVEQHPQRITLVEMREPSRVAAAHELNFRDADRIAASAFPRLRTRRSRRR